MRSGVKRVEGWQRSDWTQPATRLDESLITILAQAHAWREQIEAGGILTLEDLSSRTGHNRKYVRRVLKLAFLAPDIQRDVLTGRQPRGLALPALTYVELPLAWDEQRTLLSILIS